MKYLKTYESKLIYPARLINFLYPTKDEDIKDTCEYLNNLHVDFKLYKNLGYKTLFKDINTFIAFKSESEKAYSLGISDIIINRSIQFTDSNLKKDILDKEIEFDEIKQEEINLYITAKKYNNS